MIDPNSDIKQVNAFQSGTLAPRRNPTLVNRITRAIFPRLPWYGPQESEQDQTQTGVTSSLVTALYDRFFKYEVARERQYKDLDEMDNSSEEFSLALDTIASNICVSEEGQQETFIVRANGLINPEDTVTPQPLVKQAGLQNEDVTEDEEEFNPPSQKQSRAKAVKIQEILDRTTKKCQLHTAVRPLARNALKYGDAFGEIVANRNLEVVAFKQLPPGTMQRHEDLKGNLILGKPSYEKNDRNVAICTSKEGENAFQQIDEQGMHKVIAAFWPWQIVHVRLNWDGFSPYGRAMGRVARLTWRRLKAIEESMVIGRMTRDLLKLIFYVDTTGLSPDQAQVVLNNFQQQMTQKNNVGSARDNPFNVMTDFYLTDGYVRINNQAMPLRTRIEPLDPKNEGLHNITDVEYLQRKFLAMLWVPNAHLGFENEVGGKNILSQQDVQYVRRLREVQSILSAALSQIYDTALILAGIDPEEAEYEIIWPSLKAIDELTSSQAEYQRAMSDALMLGNSQQNGTPVIDQIYILKHRMNLTDDEINEIVTRMAKTQEIADQKQQAQLDQAHKRQVDLASANKTGEPAPAAPAKAGNGGRKRAVASEVLTMKEVIAETVQLLDQDFREISKEQKATLDMLSDLKLSDKEFELKIGTNGEVTLDS